MRHPLWSRTGRGGSGPPESCSGPGTARRTLASPCLCVFVVVLWGFVCMCCLVKAKSDDDVVTGEVKNGVNPQRGFSARGWMHTVYTINWQHPGGGKQETLHTHTHLCSHKPPTEQYFLMDAPMHRRPRRELMLLLLHTQTRGKNEIKIDRATPET